MIVSMVFKGILFYFGFLFLKQVFKVFQTVQAVKSGAENFQNMRNDQGRSHQGQGSRDNSDVVEAEFRVVKD